jgi:glucose-1-phosphate cytidylyltransferase
LKVVLFCGGQGMRLREYSETVPKPMVPVGHRPILWHVMRYYAHHGHTDFILCLGYRGEAVKEYFLSYNEALSNDFVLSEGGRSVELLNSDIHDWRITFVDTGLHANIGERLRAVRRHLNGEEMFLASYGDVLTDAPIGATVDNLAREDKIGSFLCVRPSYTFHVVKFGDGGLVAGIEDVTQSDLWLNGGYFVFKREIFDYLGEGEELVLEPFQRLIEKEQLIAYRYEGFWAPMDTLKDRQVLESLWERGTAPWAVWQPPAPEGADDLVIG